MLLNGWCFDCFVGVMGLMSCLCLVKLLELLRNIGVSRSISLAGR